MKTVLITAYAVNPLKGSEDGMGWNYIVQAARNHSVMAVTRKNNRPAIEQYIAADAGNKEVYDRISFLYFDWPQWTIKWKKGPLLSMIYYYLWQLTLALWIKRQRLSFDLAHNLNFHNDWTPSFLWMLNKPFVWGPVGHHPAIPAEYISKYGRKELVKDRMLWLLKNAFWKFDPLLAIARKRSGSTWYMHSASKDKLQPNGAYFLHPSIAATAVKHSNGPRNQKFTVLSVGRFVPLKGFDVAIKSFAAFYNLLNKEQQANVQMIIVGKGPYKKQLMAIIAEQQLTEVIRIIEWMPQSELDNVYNSADVFLYPSHEGAGMVVAEAMRYGLPVVCWDNAGPGNIVHPGTDLKVAYCAYADAISHFSNKLHQLLTDKLYYSAESAMALDRFKSNLSWDVKAGQLAHFYTQGLSAA